MVLTGSPVYYNESVNASNKTMTESEAYAYNPNMYVQEGDKIKRVANNLPKKAKRSSFFGCCTSDNTVKQDLNLSDQKVLIVRPETSEKLNYKYKMLQDERRREHELRKEAEY